MARQILVGADVTSATNNGIAIYKKNASGEPTLLVAADDLATAPEVQFCRVGSGECSPWISGLDIKGFSGVSGVAQAAQSLSVVNLTPTAGGNTVTLKLIDKSSGSEPFVRETIEFVTGATANLTAAAMHAAITTHIAGSYNGMIGALTAYGGAATVVFAGHTYAGPTALGYNKQTNIELAFDPGVDAAAGITVTDTPATSTLGDPYILADFEKDLIGERSGDYYRVQQPNNTTYYAPAASGNVAHDVYCLEWGSPYKHGQINKVDNSHVLYIAVAHAAAGAGSAPGTWVQTGGATGFESNFNNWLAHTPRYGTGAPGVAL